jgi:hypothetical protein
LKHSRGRGNRRRSCRRLSGVLIRSLAFLGFVVACIATWRWATEPRTSMATHQPLQKSSITLPTSFRAPSVQSRNGRVVFPYSVVPGGVTSSAELQAVAAHDPVVAEHYAGFDYNRARVIEVSQPKLVYLSYRRGDKIFWTHKQASLHKGEKLLTDGHTTARSRCGNQVSVLPQANTSQNEPTMAELDRPDEMASGMNRVLPSTFDSDLMVLDPGLPFGTSTSSLGNLFAGGPPPGGFMPMPIGGGFSTTSSGKPPQCQPGDTSEECNPHTPPPPPPPPPPVVPEPGTIVLVVSGAAAVWARAKYRKA